MAWWLDAVWTVDGWMDGVVGDELVHLVNDDGWKNGYFMYCHTLFTG